LAILFIIRVRRGHDHIVVGFTTTYTINAYHHWCCEFESQSGWGVHHYVVKFVSDLRQVSGFLQIFRFPPPIKLTTRYHWNIVENGIKYQKPNQTCSCSLVFLLPKTLNYLAFLQCFDYDHTWWRLLQEHSMWELRKPHYGLHVIDPMC
jgi:hypothetical protein